MTGNEDCASVLEQFMHDVANLPAEITHMMEEIQAKDKEMQQYLSSINHKDGQMQKQIKMQGSMSPHPKEKEWSESISKSYDICQELQDQKISLSDKACLLLERQLKKLDVKIRELQNDGQLQDGPALPSVFNRKAQHSETQRQFSDLPIPSQLPLQIASASAINMNAHRMNNQHIPSPHIAQPIPRQLSQISTAPHSAARSSAPATPASALQHQQQRQREREHSAGAADLKRRKLNTSSSFSANVPTQPSNLRQSSLGPGTPKAGTPTGTSRAGSLPRSTTSQVVVGAAVKKSSLSKKVAPHQQISKLKGKPGPKQGRLPFKKKGGRLDSPSHRSRGTTADSGDADSVLSSADASDAESHTTRSRRGASAVKKQEEPNSDVEMAEGDEEEDQEDDKRYCFCNERSYGEMVACENDHCDFEWFHLQCLGLKKPPPEDELWYCPKCRDLEEVKKILREKGLSGSKMPGQQKVWPSGHTISVK